ncbi:MAG TPA: DUF4388 domain-containing protein [Blastocatellia bacterium]|nr:DUF4388 domain-containing protein [Blastocatellia bacterium]
MELTGDLSDFGFADILQILSLGRKTGTVCLENGVVKGRVVVEEGRITSAWMSPGDGFGRYLVGNGLLDEALLGKLERLVVDSDGLWVFEGLLTESGLMSERAVVEAAESYIRGVVVNLLSLERGRFGIRLNEAQRLGCFDEVRLDEGLEVGGVLLEVAKEFDERSRGEAKTQGSVAWSGNSLGGESSIVVSLGGDSGSLDARVEEGGVVVKGSVSTRAEVEANTLCSMLAELKNYSRETEVRLMILRFASEVASRGMLFRVDGENLNRLGGFGIRTAGNENGLSGDGRVVESIPLESENIVARAARTGEPFVGRAGLVSWDEHIGKVLLRIPEGRNGEVFSIPVINRGNVQFVVYGDNYPGYSPLGKTGELIAFVDQVGLLLEKICLERDLNRIGPR